MTTTQTAAARVSGTIKALYERACDLVRHEADCPARGRGDEYCKCDAVPFLNDFEALAAIQPDPEPQPVAWRYRPVDKKSPWSNVTEHRRTAYGRIGMEEQPLYATPSSAGTASVEAAYSLEVISTVARVSQTFASGCDRCDADDLEKLEEAGLMDRGVCEDEFGQDSLEVGEVMWTFNAAGEAIVRALAGEEGK